MPPIPVTPTGKTRCCLAYPGGENVTPNSAVSQPSPSYGSASRTWGHRSLDTVRSVRGFIRGRRPLNTATNAIPAKSCSSCSSSPVGSATKQRWYGTTRSDNSQMPLPDSQASSTPTLKRRLFKTATSGTDQKKLAARTCESEISPTVLARSQKYATGKAQALRTPLPKLDLPGLDTDLRRTTTFRACSERAIREIDKKYDGTTPRYMTQLDVNKDIFMTATESIKLRRSEAKVVNGCQQLETSLAMKCDVHYPLIPSAPSRTEHFDDTAAALSHYCLNNMLCGNSEYSKIILWTLHTSMTSSFDAQQSFTVLPNYLKPDRNALGTTYQWAIIVFRDDTAPSRVPSAVRPQYQALQAAIAKMVNMGYHIDVWTKSDNYSWREARLRALGTGDCQGPGQSLREKYQAMTGHGIPGFCSYEVETIDEVLRIQDPASDLGDSETACSEVAQQNNTEIEDDPGHGSDFESDFQGFLEHQEESTLPAGSETRFKLYDESHISGVSEDLDMATRLGGKTFA